MIPLDDFNRIRAALGDVAEKDIEWSEGLKSPANADEFALEIIFVICNSGMKNTVARGIYDRCVSALIAGRPITKNVFGHKGKVDAIKTIWNRRERLFREFLDADDKLAFAKALPWIGPITCYHVAKNFGADVAKPDVHLQRLADQHGCTVQELCADLAKQLGLRVCTVDTVLWRACANGVINSNTGEIHIERGRAAQFTAEAWRHG